MTYGVSFRKSKATTMDFSGNTIDPKSWDVCKKRKVAKSTIETLLEDEEEGNHLLPSEISASLSIHQGWFRWDATLQSETTFRKNVSCMGIYMLKNAGWGMNGLILSKGFLNH